MSNPDADIPDKNEFMAQLSRELHKPARKTFPRLKVRSRFKNEIWSCDLVEMGEWSAENDGYKYMLNVVDVFTRYAWSRPLKSKSALDTFAAFLDIIDTDKVKPKHLYVDQGKEFYNTYFKQWSKTNQSTMYSTFGESKSSIVERFNRTLKNAMWQKFTQNNNRRWIDILQTLINDYNNKKHSTIKMTPTEALKPENQKKLLEINDPKPLDEQSSIETKKAINRKPKFEIGDAVRISRVKGIFEKGYYPNFSQEVYKIVGYNTPFDIEQPITYIIKDSKGEEIKGSFYEQELQLAKYPNVLLIESVLKKKKINNKPHLLVKYLGYPDSFNKWIPESDIIHDFNQ